MLGRLQRIRRRVTARTVPYKAILGDANGNVYAEDGYYWVRPYDQINANGFATPGAAYRVRAGVSLIVPRAGRVVWIGPGLDKHLTVLGYDHADLIKAGINPSSTQPNDPYREWIRLKDIQNFRALPIGTGASPSLSVQVRQLFYYTPEGDMVRWNGTNESTQIDLTSYVPAATLQRYVALWLRVYNPNGLSDIQVTSSSTISSISGTLSFTELQECADAADADTIPIQAFRLANAQTALTLDDTVDVDLRQFINMPQVWGFPNTVARAYRIHEGFSVVAPSAVNVESGGLVQIQGDALLVILSLDEAGDSGSSGITELVGDVTAGPGSGSQPATLAAVNADVGSFTAANITVNAKGLITAAANGSAGMTSFNVAADAGAPETISNGNTLMLAGGTGIDTTASATDTVTIAIDSTVATLTGAQTLTNKTLTAPVIADFTTAQHDHADADDGGNITGAAFGVQTQLKFLAGPVSGSPAIPTFRSIDTNDLGGAITMNALSNVVQYENFDPDATQGSGAGYLTGHWWINILTDQVFQSVDDTPGAAVWKRLSDPSDTAGDTTYYDGSDTIALPIGTAKQYLRVNAGATAPEWATPTVVNWQYFDTPGATTWTKPAGAFLVRVICVGGGSGGGSGMRRATGLARGGGAGGAAGAVTDVTYAASQLGATEPLTVGAGGAGGIAVVANDTAGFPGIQGGDTFFGGTTAANSIQMAVSAPGVLGGGRGGTGAATSDGGVAGVTFGPAVQFYGSSGGAVVSVTPSPAPVGSFGPGGGGGGGGLTAGNVAVTGADGASGQGAAFRPAATGGGGAANVGLNGTAGADAITDGSSNMLFGSGGGGASGLVAGTGQNGGYGGRPGGGGGGGSASNNGSSSGLGGYGGNGGVYVISYCL